MMRFRGILAGILSITFAGAFAGCAASGEDAPQQQAAAANAGQGFAETGPYAVDIAYDHWTDHGREREIPVKIYRPDADAPTPVVIFSHGLGGGIEAAGYLGEHLASWGILAVHIQHPGSDREIWRGVTGRANVITALRDAVRDPQVTINRHLDVPFVINEIERRRGALNADPARLGIAGHSFGAHTVLAAAGRRYLLDNQPPMSFKDERVDAGVLLSSPAPGDRVSPADYAKVYGAIDIPLLHMTGTEDDSPVNPALRPEDRQIPFRQIDSADQYLVVFDGGDHAVFSGRARPGQPEWYPVIQQDVASAATTFFMAYLVEDDTAIGVMKGDTFLKRYDIRADVSRKLAE